MANATPWFELGPITDIESLGYIEITNRHPARKGMPYWVLVLVNSGRRTVCADGNPIQIGPGEFFLLPPNSEQAPCRLDEHSACFVHFAARGSRIDAPVHIDPAHVRLPLHGSLPYTPDCFALLRYLCSHALSPYANEQFLKTQLQALLSIISLHCQKTPDRQDHSGLSTVTLLHYIKDHACVSLRSQDYEKEFGLSYHHINLLFKKQFGCTVKQYHFRIRMEHAAQLLISGCTLQETAERCGFDDYFFFINSFTKAHGISPAAYQSRHSGT